MKFYGEPNLTVIDSRPKRPTDRLLCVFDENGVYETDSEYKINKLKLKFKHDEIEEKPLLEESKHKCKKCGEEFENKGLLMAHYREHKKEVI